MQTDTQFDVLFDKRRQEYLAETRALLSSYMHRQQPLKTNLFMSFSEWPQQAKGQNHSLSFEAHKSLFDAKNSDLQEGGYFVCLQETGICINPGRNFFEKVCQQGYTLQDIDIVIATNPDRSIQEAITELYSLNRESSRTLTSYGQDPHIIRFFLHPDLSAHLASLFRPMFREELASLVSLETFTKTGEKLQISELLSLSYTKTLGSGLAIRIDAQAVDLSFGFLACGGYREELNDFFAPCTTLLAGIGECSPEDLEQVAFQPEHLGYYGLLKLLEHTPSLQACLVSEFSRSMGDIRLELLQKLRAQKPMGPKVLPVDNGFCLHLDPLAVKMHGKTFCSYEDVRVIRPFGSFGPLLFLADGEVL